MSAARIPLTFQEISFTEGSEEEREGVAKQKKKKAADLADSAAWFLNGGQRLTLGELEALPGTGLSSLLPLFGAGITAQVAGRLERAAQFQIHLREGTCRCELDSTGLTRKATAPDNHLEVKLVDQIGGLERSENLILQGKGGEVLLEGTIIDDDLAGSFSHPDAGDGGLAATGGGVDGFSGGHGRRTFSGQAWRSFGSERVGLGLLGILLVFGTSVDLQLVELGAAKPVVRDHAADGSLNEQFGSAGPDFLGSLHLLAPDISRITGVDLLCFLVSAEADLRGIDDYDVITGVGMGSEDWLVLATKQAGGLHCHLAEDLVGGIDEMPLAFHVGSFGGKSLH